MTSEAHMELEATLGESAAPIFNMVEPLRDPQSAEQVDPAFRSAIEQAFIELERKAFEKQWPKTVTRDVRFALAAYVDELVMSSRWPQKFDWMVKPLCIEFFGDSNAGESFFERLEELRQNLRENQTVVEFYFCCLQFGFQGSYRVKGYEALQSLIANLRAELEDLSDSVPRTLADQAVPESKLVYRIGGKQPYWVMASIGAAVLVTMIVAYGSMMRTALTESAQGLESLEVTRQATHTEASNG